MFYNFNFDFYIIIFFVSFVSKIIVFERKEGFCNVFFLIFYILGKLREKVCIY